MAGNIVFLINMNEQKEFLFTNLLEKFAKLNISSKLYNITSRKSKYRLNNFFLDNIILNPKYFIRAIFLREKIIVKDVFSDAIETEIEVNSSRGSGLILLLKNSLSIFGFYISYLVIDDIRKGLDIDTRIHSFYLKKDPVLKILHVTNFNQRFNGRLHYNTGRRLNDGFIRLGHNVLTLSDRDILNKSKNITDIKGHKALQRSIIDAYSNFKSDCIILGHADSVSNDTLDYLKNKNKNLRIAQWFLDPVGKMGPDFIKNTRRITEKEKFIDTTFLTTDPSILPKKIKNSFFMPNPCDQSFETLKNYENDCYNDVFFAMSHGVHRGELKRGKTDDREIFINKLIKKNRKINFDIYGMNKVQPIWGGDFINKIANSSMGINLSRGKPVKYYSSDRIAQLLGNGLLTFIDNKTFFKDFLTKDQIIFYNDIDDLSYKLNKYKKDRKERIRIARNGKEIYLKKFNSTLVSDFILSKTFDYKSKNKFIWSK